MSIPAKVVLASDDLQARARVLAAAEPLGIRVDVVSPGTFAAEARGAELLILDLDGGRDAGLAELTTLVAEGSRPAHVVGFLSHVDGELARAARAAGVRAIPRGRFWAQLRELLAAPASYVRPWRSDGTAGPGSEPHEP